MKSGPAKSMVTPRNEESSKLLPSGAEEVETAFNILIEGKADDFTVKLGIGKWFTDLPLTQVENLPLPEIFFPFCIILNKLGEIEIAKSTLNRISRSIDSLVESTR